MKLRISLETTTCDPGNYRTYVKDYTASAEQLAEGVNITLMLPQIYWDHVDAIHAIAADNSVKITGVYGNAKLTPQSPGFTTRHIGLDYAYCTIQLLLVTD